MYLINKMIKVGSIKFNDNKIKKNLFVNYSFRIPPQLLPTNWFCNVGKPLLKLWLCSQELKGKYVDSASVFG